MRRFSIIAAMAIVIGTGSWVAASRTASAAEIDVSFSLNEKQIISSFFADSDGGGAAAGQGKGKGKGKKNKGVSSQGMPPGLAMKGGPMPPGIAKRQLPGNLVALLPPPPEGFERVIVDNDVLLIDIATQVIHVALTDILR